MDKYSRYNLVYTNYRKRYRKYKDFGTGRTFYVALVNPNRELKRVFRNARSAVIYLNRFEERLARGRDLQREQDTCDDSPDSGGGRGAIPDGEATTPPSDG